MHALGQVAHVDLDKDWRADKVRDALNAHLRPHPVAVLSAEKVADEFDARFSAKKRHYLYRIANRRPDLALDRLRAWRVPRRLDAEAMHAAAQRLLGKHDFTTFRVHRVPGEVAGEDARPARCDAARATRSSSRRRRARSCTIRCARWSARSRYVGDGKWSADDLAAALAARDRAACAPVAPPEGCIW